MDKLKFFIANPTGNAILVSLYAFLVYLKTLAPSVTFIDSGELAAVACTLGIAHPTGYPMFTLLGWFFSKLPIASEEIVRLNIMAAFFCAFGIFIFYHLVHFVLTGAVGKGSSSKSKKKEDNAAAIRVASAGASLLLAFSETYWSQAVAIEVYSLHVLFLSLVTYSFFKAVYGDEWRGVDKEEQKSSSAWWYIFAFTLGLSFTNHMTTILLAPGFLYLYFATQGFDASSWKRIGRMVVPFMIGFSVYLYLPFRASQSPLMNWGNPVTLEKFLWHWTGKQYRVWIFSSTEAAGRQFKYFFKSLPGEFAYVGLILALVGGLVFWRASRKITITILLLFFGCVFYSINYDIHDIDSYFLLAYVCIALLAGAGLLAAYRWLNEKMGVVALSSLLVVLSIAPLITHYKRTDETKNRLVEDYTMNMFASFQSNALVLSYQWDYWVSASFYYQHVRGYRKDVTVVDKELLRRSWYFKQLERTHPWLVENSRAEIDAFLRELHKFEHELPYQSDVIQARFVEMIRSFITKNISTRPVYVTTEIEPEFTTGMQRVPEGLALRVYADTLKHEMRNVEFKFRNFERSGRLEDALKNLYASALSAKAIHLIQSGNIELAVAELRRALSYSPNSPEANNILQQLSSLRR
jgi:tetratricopeptide (TPR) repeat protein